MKSNHVLRYLLPILLFFFFFNILSTKELPAQEQIGQVPPAGSRVKSLKVKVPPVVLADVGFDIMVEAVDEEGIIVKTFSEPVQITGIELAEQAQAAEAPPLYQFQNGKLTLENAKHSEIGIRTLTVTASKLSTQTEVRIIPGILSLLPPLLAIALAFITRQTLISLFSGIWLGAIFVNGYNPITGFMSTLDTYLVKSLSDSDHASILVFSLTLGGMIGVIAKSGGTQGIVEKLSKYAKNARGGQLATSLMGLFIFFDDYANTLIVGNTMRPFTDKLRISREKLSYIVDSTAAPVASVALISTWIGFQVGLIDQAFNSAGIEHNAYHIFVQSIPYASYSLLAVVFVFLVSISLRDFGPMKAAELRASDTGKVLRDGAQPITDSSEIDLADEHTPLRWHNALIPIVVVIVVTFCGLYYSGSKSLGTAAAEASIGQIVGEANSFSVLLWASFAGLFVAGILAVVQRILTLNEVIQSAVRGYKSMMMAAMILVLAWAIGNICQDLNTADYVITATKGIISPHLVPFLTFVVAAFISFSTGSSWATMAILTPIVVPIAYQLPHEAQMAVSLDNEILIGTVGAILSGSVLGDHCSPISDTTILSSMASSADHVDHVRTQMPYALLVAAVASVTGYIPNGWGWNKYLSLIIGAAILAVFIYTVGKKSSYDIPE